MSPAGPGRSIDIPCEGTIPAASLSMEESGSSAGGGMEGNNQGDFREFETVSDINSAGWVSSQSREAVAMQ